MALLSEQFKDEDRIPVWLFVVWPKSADTPPAFLRFNGDCAVIETADAFHVIPERFRPDGHGAGFEIVVCGVAMSVILQDDRPYRSYQFVAASKPVMFPLQNLKVSPGEGTDMNELPPFTYRGKD